MFVGRHAVPYANGDTENSGFRMALFWAEHSPLWASGIAELVRHAEFLAVLDEYDMVLTGPPGWKE